jgi:hypothetical protein
MPSTNITVSQLKPGMRIQLGIGWSRDCFEVEELHVIGEGRWEKPMWQLIARNCRTGYIHNTSFETDVNVIIAPIEVGVQNERGAE